MQIHHIDENPANNELNNLAVLCLECHDETQVRGGFGRRLSAAEVTLYRDAWLASVRKRHDAADALAAEVMAGGITGAGTKAPTSSSPWTLSTERQAFPSRVGLAEYIHILPILRRRAYLTMLGRKATTTLAGVDAFLELSAVLEGALITLLGYYPEAHFSEYGAQQYVSQVVAERTHWHYLRCSDQGVGQSGSLVQTTTASAVARDLERMIAETVSTVTGADLRHPEEEEEDWHRKWREQVQMERTDA